MEINLAAVIDHTLLKAEATSAEINQVCQEAKEFHFASVCVQPVWVKQCAEFLQGSGVAVCTVIGFPLGANLTESKVYEAQRALADGATELDMVLNLGALKEKRNDVVRDEITQIVRVAQGNALVKVIIETALLTTEEKSRACQLSQQAGADFVKTSTGFASAGATVEDVRLMRATVGPLMGVKASGGIRDRRTAWAMMEAGATRLGTSASLAIISEKVE